MLINGDFQKIFILILKYLITKHIREKKCQYQKVSFFMNLVKRLKDDFLSKIQIKCSIFML